MTTNISGYISAQFAKHRSKILVGLITLIVLIMFGKPAGLWKIFLFFTFLVITAAISYWLGAMRSPVDASPTFFLMVIFGQKLGFFYALIFMVLSSTVPFVLAGGELDGAGILFSGAFLFLTAISGLFISLGIVKMGLILSILLVVIGFAINRVTPDQGGMFMTITHAGITAAYFMLLGNILMQML